MSWQDVAKEFDCGTLWDLDAQPDATQRMAEEIVLLRQRLGPAGYEMLLELKRLREENEELDGIVNRTEFRSTLEQQAQLEQKLARSENKRAKLRETLRIIGLAHEMKRGELQRTAICEMTGKALAADSAEDNV